MVFRPSGKIQSYSIFFFILQVGAQMEFARVLETALSSPPLRHLEAPPKGGDHQGTDDVLL